MQTKVIGRLAWVAFATSAIAAPASGPLRPLKNNPRYFTDGSGRAIYLAGSHNWHNFQDNGHRFPESQDPPPKFDYTAYLDFLVAHHHNFFRLWRWEAPKWADAQPKGMIKFSEPHPWMRTGPGAASDGKPKFDLLKFNPDYFDRMRARIIAARERGIYVSVMLFEGWELQFTDAWTYHPFNRANNINGVDADADGDGKGVEFDALEISPMGKRVLALQEAYLRHVVDTVNDLDNVLYEVCNEAAGASTPWQYHVIEYLHEYQGSKPKQHPVGMTFEYANGANALLYNSPADWVSPNPGDPEERFRDNPWPARAGKVIVNDTDHLWGHTGGDNVWVWKSFTRGLNVLFMEELLPSPTWQDSARAAMGQTRMFADRMNLAEMTPSREISNTGYCLANHGKEYLVFQSDKGEFTVNLSDAAGQFSVEWFNITNGATEPAKQVAGGAVRTFTTPFGGPAALYLKLASPQ
jgi:hypothetical protein